MVTLFFRWFKSMKTLIFFSLIFFVSLPIRRACDIKFNDLDDHEINRRVHERDIFNITGQLQFCPSSLTVRNISVDNRLLKRLSILNVTYLLEPNRLNITALARLIGFAPLTIHLYFQTTNEYQSIRSSQSLPVNATDGQLACARSYSDQEEILRNCPMLQYKNGHFVLNHTISVAIKRHQSVIDTLFTSVVIVLMTMGTLCIGCGLEMEQLVSNIKRPIPLIVGLVCQVVYLPLLSVAISKIFRLDNPTALGLLTTASTPGMCFCFFL